MDTVGFESKPWVESSLWDLCPEAVCMHAWFEKSFPGQRAEAAGWCKHMFFILKCEEGWGTALGLVLLLCIVHPSRMLTRGRVCQSPGCDSQAFSNPPHSFSCTRSFSLARRRFVSTTLSLSLKVRVTLKLLYFLWEQVRGVRGEETTLTLAFRENVQNNGQLPFLYFFWEGKENSCAVSYFCLPCSLKNYASKQKLCFETGHLML